MRKIKYFKDFIFEDHDQMELPFDNQHPIHDKPVHVHLVDALDDLVVMPVGKYKSEEEIHTFVDKSLDAALKIINGTSESANDIRIDFAYQNPPWENPRMWKKSFTSEYDIPTKQKDVGDSSPDDLIDAMRNGVNIMDDVLTTEGITIWNEYLDGVFNDRISEMLDMLEQDDNGLIDIWRAISFSSKTDIGDFADVYNAITKGYNGLGVYWSWDQDAAEPHWGYSNNSTELVIHAKIRPEDIDWVETLYKNSYDLREEKEIRVLDNTQVMVVGFATDNNKYIEVDPRVVKTGNGSSHIVTDK